MSTNAQKGCGRGENKYVKEIHFLHSFPGLFPNCPQFARETRVHNNVQYTHSAKKNLFTYYIIASSSFTFSYITQLLLLILRKKSTDIHTIHTTIQSLTFSQAKFFTYANVHCKPTNVR